VRQGGHGGSDETASEAYYRPRPSALESCRVPELPEVEVTARALNAELAGQRIEAVRVHEPRLRWPVPAGLDRTLQGSTVLSVGRRGKYLLWQLPAGVLLAHLGMSGSWRVHAGRAPPRERHDHVEILAGASLARYHDPRRFGALLWHPAGDGPVQAHPLLARLGVEPLEPGFDGPFLHAALRGRSTPIKPLLLAGEVVVGVGNIYASEALFHAGIHPATPAGRIGAVRAERLAQAIGQVLELAIRVGGSSLRDFSRVDGASGRYTEFAQVYERAGQTCRRCGGTVRRAVQGQRATYFCPACQRR
jgi:formamidopyrimidine-DNA glycosylase